MKVLLLGTAAAEGYPGLFCECARCRNARTAGGKNLRLRAAARVNEDLLIDLGPDLLAATHLHKISLAGVRAALITHFHEDHWWTPNLLYRHAWFRENDLPTLHLYGGPRLEEEMGALCDWHRISPEDLALRLHVVEELQKFSAGPYVVQALPAAHAPSTEPRIYAIARVDKRLLYATDTGPFPEPTWEALAGFQAHLVVMELTMGNQTSEGHMGWADFLAARQRMSKESVISPEAKIIAHHFSHHHTPLHEELEAELAVQGVLAGYDGMEVQV